MWLHNCALPCARFKSNGWVGVFCIIHYDFIGTLQNLLYDPGKIATRTVEA